MNGRMYRVPQIESYPLFTHGVDGQITGIYDYTDYEVFADLVVPNGTWVLERPSFGYTWLVGAAWSELRDVFIDKRPPQERLLWLADKPFGFVQSEEAKYLPGTDTQVPVGPQSLSYARQIHKGELGQGVPIPRLQFAREHPDNARKLRSFPRNRSQRRNPFRWARLSDVAAAAGIPVFQLVTSYWPFTGHSYDSVNQRSDELLHVRLGASTGEIGAQHALPYYLTLEELRIRILGGQMYNIWIRAGLANTFLRLCALDYQPATTTALV
jgi:hypothetical protein